ncbi:fimbrial protein [Pseudomonas sp. RU47]|uniref:fimbria/pilus chaperone family protein n=1 Tax=Pseudomonas sp. RU47 TaxID=2005388 RepID=UPI000FDEBB08|nr:fimbria/pilus chaperone family protein [Pseudomonas sp. RU47]AZZ77752.1 fimbrial protein [Pseudomonas sp. RU47]
MRLSPCFFSGIILCFTSLGVEATGMVPQTSVVIVEQSEGEGAVNVKSTDTFPNLLLTTIENIPEDTETLVSVIPPVSRVEAGKIQRVRFIMTSQVPLKTERLKRVIFEGVPPQKKDVQETRISIVQNLPMIIRPAGLEKDLEPWKHLVWKIKGSNLELSNPSPYVVRLGQNVQTLPDNTSWTLPNAYVLPGQMLTIVPEGDKHIGVTQKVRISPATTWGFSAGNYDSPLAD